MRPDPVSLRSLLGLLVFLLALSPMGALSEEVIVPSHHDESSLFECYSCLKKLAPTDAGRIYRSKIYCDECFEKYPLCSLCSMPVGPYNKGWSDGNTLVCLVDAPSSAVTKEQLPLLQAEAERLIAKTFGESFVIRQNRIRTTLLTEAQMQKKYREEVGRNAHLIRGLASLELHYGTTIVELLPVTIYISDGLSRASTLQTLIHEYAHLWHAENAKFYPSLPVWFKEGFAEWFAFKVLERNGYSEMALGMLERRDEEYQRGLRYFFSWEANLGDRGVLKRIQEF